MVVEQGLRTASSSRSWVAAVGPADWSCRSSLPRCRLGGDQEV